MKHLFIVIATLFLFSCSQSEEEKKIEELNNKIEAIKSNKERQDSALNYYVAISNQLHDDLDQITYKQKGIILKLKDDPGSLDQPDSQINKDIKAIGELITSSEENIAIFKEKIAMSEVNLKDFDIFMENITKNIDRKNFQIKDLQSQLEAVDVAFDDLFVIFDETLTELDITKLDLEKTKNNLSKAEKSLEESKKYNNTVWYVMGTKKELVKKGIVSSEGGIIGLGKNNELSGEFNISYFTKGSRNKLKKINIPEETKKLDFITSHPKSSYHVEGKILKIVNSNDFWSISKYLVIVLK